MQLELSKFNTSHYSLLANTVFAIYIPYNSKPDTNTLYRLQGPRLFQRGLLWKVRDWCHTN